MSDIITEQVIKPLVEIESAKKRTIAEANCKKQQMPQYENETQRIVHEMLVENTGAHMMDSGGESDRNWQAARKVPDFRDVKEVVYSKYGNVTRHVFHIITENLEYDPELDAEFRKFAGEDAGMGEMEEFCEQLGEGQYQTYNTFNDECYIGSQVLQFCTAEIAGKNCIILQIHGGCDVRGGYTIPRVFTGHMEDFIMAGTRAGLSCDCKSASLSGPDIMADDGDETVSFEDGIFKEWSWADEKLHCKDCKKEIAAF